MGLGSLHIYLYIDFDVELGFLGKIRTIYKRTSGFLKLVAGTAPRRENPLRITMDPLASGPPWLQPPLGFRPPLASMAGRGLVACGVLYLGV